MRWGWGALLLAAVASQSHADERWRVGAGGALSSTDSTANTDTGFKSGVLPSPPPELSIDGFAYDGDVGAWRAVVAYRATPRLWIEASYTDLGEFDGSDLIANLEEPLTLAADTVELSGVVRYELTDSFYALWSVGLALARFDAEGRVVVSPIFPPFPGATRLQFADPDEEIGFTWGAGFGWQAGNGVALELAYRRHAIDVINVETVGLDLSWSFGD